MLDYCGEKNITCDVEVPPSNVSTHFYRIRATQSCRGHSANQKECPWYSVRQNTATDHWPSTQLVDFKLSALARLMLLSYLLTMRDSNVLYYTHMSCMQVIDMDYVNTAMERLERNDVHYRFSIDVLGSLLPPAA